MILRCTELQHVNKDSLVCEYAMSALNTALQEPLHALRSSGVRWTRGHICGD